MLKLKDYELGPDFPRAPVSSPTVSPDGEKILYVKGEVYPEEERQESHIWMVSTNGGDSTQITLGNGNDSNPKWSPDGKTIYFLSNRTVSGEKGKRKNRLWALPLTGGEASLIAEAENSISNPHVSPDGEKILFQSRINEDSECPENIKEGALWITKLRWKMNGQPYYPYTRMHIFVVPSKGGDIVQLTKGPYDASSPSWSPDSSQVAYLANKEESDYIRIRDVYVVPVEGGTARKVTNGEYLISSVAWSPDGKLLAYGGRKPTDPKYPAYGNTDIWMIPVEGGAVRNITSEFDRTVGAYGSQLIYGGDGALYFRAPDMGMWNVYKVHPDGGGVQAVIEGKQTVGAFGLSNDSSVIAYTLTTTTWPLELYAKANGGNKQLTNVNTDLMASWKISPPEEFWFTASDGVKVHGWIVKPWDYVEGEKYPLILKIHGGPHSQYCYRLGSMELDIQNMAMHGYTVIYTNPRDSTGYGEEFAGVIEGDWGSRDYQDLMEAVDYVLETYPYIDHDRLGVTGGSFGGFMTNWIITHTDRFKAAVTTMSISNWHSQIGTGDVSWGHSGIGNYREPWEIPEKYLKHSPLTYIENVTTPVLMMAGEYDLRCPVSQSDQLFYALKRLKKTVEYLRFKDENHGLTKYSNRKYRSKHILRWFEKYL